MNSQLLKKYRSCEDWSRECQRVMMKPFRRRRSSRLKSFLICYSECCWHWEAHNNLWSIQSGDNIMGGRVPTCIEWQRIMELQCPACKYLSNDNLAVPDVQWPVFATFPRVKLILPKKSSTFLQICNFMSRTKAALNGHRAKNSATNSESSQADASGRVTLKSECLLLLVTSISGQQRSTPPWFTPGLHSLSEARERGKDICSKLWFMKTITFEICDGEQMRAELQILLGRMSLITELI